MPRRPVHSKTKSARPEDSPCRFLFRVILSLDRSARLRQLHPMKPSTPLSGRRVALGVCLLAGAIVRTAYAGWQRDDQSIAWHEGSNVVWRFSFDDKKGKPFFHPISAGGTAFTNFKPQDHPWHYGLWFSWKYINHVNYWEEDRA